MKALTGKIALASVPFLLMVAFNLWIDPGRLFHSGLERDVAAYLAAGRAVAAPSGYDPRLVNRYVIPALAQPPDVAVLGSSRAMQIHASAFPGRRVINSATFGGSIEDLLAIAGMFDRANRLPREMVLELDPWLLNRANGLNGWRSIAADYGYMARKLGLQSKWLTRFVVPTVDKYVLLCSPPYFQTGIRRVLARPEESATSVVEPTNGEAATILPDGSRIERRTWQERTPEEVEQLAHREAAAGLYVSNFTTLDADNEQQLETLTAYLEGRGTRMIFVLLPYHPVMFEDLRSNPTFRQIVLQESYYRGLAQAHGVRLLGSHDPATAGCSGVEFFDGSHPRESCINRILGAPAFRFSP